jgi:hypothetical protein
MVDKEFSALVAANPVSAPEELLAAAASRISREIVVEQLEFVAHQPGVSPEHIASLLLQSHSYSLIQEAPPLADTGENLVPISLGMDASSERVHDFRATQDRSIDTDLGSSQTGLTLESDQPDTHQVQIVREIPGSPKVTQPGPSRPRTADPEHKLITASITVDSGRLINTSQFVHPQQFSLEPIRLTDRARRYSSHQSHRYSTLNPQIAARPPRVAALGIGMKLLSW